MNSESVIIRIDLKTSPEDHINHYLKKESAETTERIHQVIRDKKIIDDIKNKMKVQKNELNDKVESLLSKIHDSVGGVDKTEIANELISLDVVKSAGGATLKLKKLVENKYPGYGLLVVKNNYTIAKI
jgi:anti-sigma28 factor (negative regulator of flagellin synthesis)